ncbi:MAG: DciA family protein [Acidobacteriota bacterium]
MTRKRRAFGGASGPPRERRLGATTSLGDLLAAWADRGQRADLAAARAEQALLKILGQRLAPKVVSCRRMDDALLVELADDRTRRTLVELRREVLGRLRGALGDDAPRRLELAVGNAPQRSETPPEAQPKPVGPKVEAALAEIDDETLRTRLRRLVESRPG